MKKIFRLISYIGGYWWLLVIAGVSLLGVTGANLISPWLVRDLTALLTEDMNDGTMPAIVNIALILTVSYAARMIFRFLYQYLAHVAAWRVVGELRVHVYAHLQKLSLRYYHDKQTGQLMSRVVNDTAVLESLVAHAIPDITTNLLILAGVTVILLFLNPTLTLLTMIPMPFVFVGSWMFSKRVLPTFRKAQQSLAEVNATLQDDLSGMREIQVFNQQARERGKIHGKVKTYTDAILKALKLSNFFHPTIEFVTSLGTVIVVAFGGMLAINNQLSVPDIVGFLLYLGMFYAPISVLARVTEELSQAIAGAERVFEVLDSEPDIYDHADAKDIGRASGNLSFDGVTFSYNDEALVLDDVSFDIPPGHMIAFVGPTGVGKTTTASLIARFYDPEKGSIRLDGQDLRSITLKSLRDNISVVLQDVFLFNGTIAENISYGRKNATEHEIVEAAKAAHIHDFIAGLQEGYDTSIGERGVRLSGGQKQRISIARAILRDSPVLILDEATASVDVETEGEIQAAINALAGSRTIIVIAHRLSTVRRCDRIYVMEEGRIVQSGTHDELLEDAEGTYARLCAKQLF